MNSGEENKAYLDGIRDAQAMVYTKSMQEATRRTGVAIKLVDSPATTSATTYSIRVGSTNNSVNWFVGRHETALFNTLLAKNVMTLTEIAG